MSRGVLPLKQGTSLLFPSIGGDRPVNGSATDHFPYTGRGVGAMLIALAWAMGKQGREMQWSKLLPRNRWPHDMVIRINDTPHHLTLLLFVREAWSIARDLDIPPLNPAPDCGHSRMPESADAARWGQRWKAAWEQAWSWYEIEDPTQHPTSAEMQEAEDPNRGLSPFIPPFWTQRYEWVGLDRNAYQVWDQGLTPKVPHDAERRSLQALIPAWKSGIDTIVVLPYKGYFAQRFSQRHLAVSADVRNDPESYSRALTESAPS